MSLLLQAVFCCYWWPHLTYVFLVLAGCFQTTQCLSGPSSGLSTHNTRARSVSFPVRKFANGSNQSRCQVRRALSITLNVLIGVRAAHVIVWWQLWGGSTPALQYVGMRVTAQTTAASATEERTRWSEYDFVVNQRRTSLLKGRAEKLVRVHANARMARRMRGLDYSENYVSQSDSCSEDSDSEFEF